MRHFTSHLDHKEDILARDIISYNFFFGIHAAGALFLGIRKYEHAYVISSVLTDALFFEIDNLDLILVCDRN